MNIRIRSKVPEVSALQISVIKSSAKLHLKKVAGRGEVVLGVNTQNHLVLLGRIHDRRVRVPISDILLAAADLGYLSKADVKEHERREKAYAANSRRRTYVHEAHHALLKLGIRIPKKLKATAMTLGVLLVSN